MMGVGINFKIIKAPEVYFNTPIYHLNVNPRAPRSSEDIPLGHISL